MTTQTQPVAPARMWDYATATPEEQAAADDISLRVGRLGVALGYHLEHTHLETRKAAAAARATEAARSDNARAEQERGH